MITKDQFEFIIFFTSVASAGLGGAHGASRVSGARLTNLTLFLQLALTQNE